jgi:cytochrome c oxidase subunit 1
MPYPTAPVSKPGAEGSFYTKFWRILTTTHHTDIGMLYIMTSWFFFFLAGVAAILMRVQLMEPNNNVMTPQVYSQLFTVHGTSMIFLVVIPMFAGFGNFFVPKMIGAKDMYFPRLNALGYWLLPPAGTLIWLSGADAGWTGYAPLSVISKGWGIDMWILGLHLIGTSSILGAINFIATIFKLRSPGVTFRNMPLFVWGILVTSFLIIGATPVLAATLTFLLLDRNLGTGFFLVNLGGDPLLWQHLFWFYSHPAVYIMVLPGMGLISEIIPKMSRKRIFGYGAIAGSTILIGVFGFGVWAHHMFTTGLSISARLPFMFMTLAVAVPSGIKVFNWIATMYGGRIRLATPMLFAISFVATFFVAGATGVFQAAIPVDYILQDTYFVVGHLHYMLFGASMQSIFAATYFFFPHITGRMYNERLGQIHFLLTNIGLYALFTAMTFMGLYGMPRRVYTYGDEYGLLNLIGSLGGFTLGAAQLVFLANMLRSWLNGKPVEKPDPWE